MIIYLKDKEHGGEIKTIITGDILKLVIVTFVDDRYFLTLGKRIDSRWEEVLQQHQRIEDDWGAGLRLSGVHLKPEKGSWHPIQWGCTDREQIMLSSDNTGNIHLYQKRW